MSSNLINDDALETGKEKDIAHPGAIQSDKFSTDTMLALAGALLVAKTKRSIAGGGKWLFTRPLLLNK